MWATLATGSLLGVASVVASSLLGFMVLISVLQAVAPPWALRLRRARTAWVPRPAFSLVLARPG